MKKKIYLENNETFSWYTRLDDDCIIIHDPQPLPLIKFYEKKQPWLWRCHIDISHPNMEVWNFLKGFIFRYDAMIISSKSYERKDIPIRQEIIHPSIDPFTPKNMELTEKEISRFLSKIGVERDKPIITQVSRFDKWKDPLGVIKVFEKVSEKIDAKLVLCGGMADDDPEGPKVYEKIRKKVGERDSIMLVTNASDFSVNALQRASSVVIQKSIREGFGLTVTEAMWKGRPVIASKAGGIPLQIKNGFNGFLLRPNDITGFAKTVLKILMQKK